MLPDCDPVQGLCQSGAEWSIGTKVPLDRSSSAIRRKYILFCFSLQELLNLYPVETTEDNDETEITKTVLTSFKIQKISKIELPGHLVWTFRRRWSTLPGLLLLISAVHL